MEKFLAVVLVASLLACSCAYKYPFPNTTLEAAQVCGLSRSCPRSCPPGPDPAFHFTKSLYSPAVDASTSTNANEVEYERKEKAEFKVEAAIKATMKNVDLAAEAQPKAEAKLRAAFRSLNDNELTLSGRFTTWTLHPTTADKLVKGQLYPECVAYLTKTQRRIVVSAAIVSYDVKFKEKSLDELMTNLESELTTAGLEPAVSASLSVEYKSKVEESLAAKYGLFQVISWSSASVGDGRFVY